MKMAMLLLVSALTVLVIPAVPSPAHQGPETSLNIIFDLAEKYNESVTKEFFVEDVRPLVEAGCEDKFFCKVYEILHHRQEHNKKLVHNLKLYIDQRNANCSELLKNVTSTGVTIQLPELMRHLITCIQRKNFEGVLKPGPPIICVLATTDYLDQVCLVNLRLEDTSLLDPLQPWFD